MMVTLEEVIETLNEFSEKDPEALIKLLEHRVPCNDNIVNHETIQTAKTEYGSTVGLLGLINGLFPTYSDNEVSKFGQFVAKMKDGKLIFVKSSERNNI